MARRISELPVDVNVTGTEKLVGQNSDGTAITMTPQAIAEFVARGINHRPVLTTQPNTFARDYPVKGIIKKGQGVGLFRDTDGITKMKASDNTNLDFTIGESNHFAGNIDGLRKDLREVKANFTAPKFIVDEFVEGKKFSHGFQVKLILQDDDSFLFDPENGVGGDYKYLLEYSTGDQIILEKITMTSTGIVTYFLDYGSGAISYYMGVFNPTTGSLFIQNTGLGRGKFTGKQTTRTFSIGSGNLSSLMDDDGNIDIGVFISLSSSWNGEAYFLKSQIGLDTTNLKQKGFVTDRIDENGFLPLTLSPTDSAIRFAWREGSADYKKYILGNMAYGFGARTFELVSIGLNIDSNVLNITTQNNTTTSSVKMGIFIGGMLVKEISKSTSSSLNIDLTSEEVTLIKNSEYNLQIKITQTSQEYDSNVYKFREVEIKDNLEDYPIDWFFHEYFSSEGATTTSQNYSLDSINLKIYKITDTKILISTYLGSSMMFDVLTPSKDTSGAEPVRSFSGQSQTIGGSFSDISNTNYARVLIVMEKEDGNWVVKKTMRPTMSKVLKDEDTIEMASGNFNNTFKVKETDTEILFCLSSFSSSVKTANINFPNFYSRGISSYDTSRSVMFIKLNKADNTMQYVLNESDSFVSNYFDNFIVNTEPNFTSSTSALSIISQVGTPSVNTFKLFLSGYFFSSLNLVTEADLGDFTKFTIARLVNIPNGLSRAGYTDSYWNEKDKVLSVFTASYNSSSYSGSIQHTIIGFNSDVSDFKRTYNSSTRLFDSNTLAYSYSNIGELQTRDLQNFLKSSDKLTYSFESSYRTNPFLNNTFQGFENYVERSGNRLIDLQNKSILKTFFTFESGARSYIDRFVSPANTVCFYLNSVLEIRELDKSVQENGFSLNFSPVNSIGIALESYTDGQSGTLGYLSGSSLLTISGLNLVTGATYYIDAVSGELNANAGRLIGRAISQTEILVNG